MKLVIAVAVRTRKSLVRSAESQGGEERKETGVGPGGTGRVQVRKEIPDHKRDKVSCSKNTLDTRKTEATKKR